MAIVDDLLEQATYLATRESKGRPRQASLRRAISAAYYALFHEVVDTVAGSVLSGADSQGPIGARLRRTVTHGAVKTAAQWFLSRQFPPVLAVMRGATSGPPQPLVDVCRRLVELQEERHTADYDLAQSLTRADTLRLVSDAANAVSLLRTLGPSPDRTIFLLGCLLGDRLTKNQ